MKQRRFFSTLFSGTTGFLEVEAISATPAKRDEAIAKLQIKSAAPAACESNLRQGLVEAATGSVAIRRFAPSADPVFFSAGFIRLRYFFEELVLTIGK